MLLPKFELLPPTLIFPPIPTPPTTVKAPVPVEIDAFVAVIFVTLPPPLELGG